MMRSAASTGSSVQAALICASVLPVHSCPASVSCSAARPASIAAITCEACTYTKCGHRLGMDFLPRNVKDLVLLARHGPHTLGAPAGVALGGCREGRCAGTSAT